MTDSTLQRVWNSREAISRQCDFDPHKLVRFYQSRQKPDRTRAWRRRVNTGRIRADIMKPSEEPGQENHE